MTDDPYPRLRQVCLAFPDATEQETWGEPTFRVRNKIFAIARPGDGQVSVWCKAPPGAQEALVGADPARFFAPPYLGPKGWIGIHLDGETDWAEIRELIEESYRLIAPKRLVALLDAA